ncbi:MAG TPA: CPBP family intramembrane metalloprotease [Bacteroidetes bacterium]|nr:CPBP family intramembrane metalloprotease [Bacteroidota bacterium]
MEQRNNRIQLFPYPSLKQSFGLMVVFILSQVIITLFVFLINYFAFDSTNISLNHIFIVYVLSFILTIFFGLRQKRLPDTGELFYFNKVDPFSYLILMVLTWAILILIDPLIRLIPLPEFMLKSFEGLFSNRGPVIFLLLVVAAPVLEELLFRGIILEGFLHRYSPGKAILWSSIIFGVVHLNPWQFIAAFFGGLLIGWVYWQTRSLLPAMFIHFVINFTSYVLQFFTTGDRQTILTSTSSGGTGVYLLILLAAAVLFILLFNYLKKRFLFNNRTAEFQRTEPEIAAALKIEPHNETVQKKKKGCLWFAVGAAAILIILALIFTFSVKKLTQDTLSREIKQEIFDLAGNDDLLKGNFEIDEVRGNSFMIRMNLEFLTEPDSVQQVKERLEYVCRKTVKILAQHKMSTSIVITGRRKLPDGGEWIYGTGSFNYYLSRFDFNETNRRKTGGKSAKEQDELLQK